MRILVIVLLLLGAHFNLTAFAPAPAGEAKFYWPFAADSKSWLSAVGGLPAQSGLVTTLLSAVAGLGFIAAVLSLFGVVIPANWWPVCVIVAAAASILLYGLYIGLFAILPFVIDAVLLWGVLAQGWTAAALQSS